ncbi:hypothetical protein ACH4VR_19610 [Streptomyces sp. NPDC020883]|uniref:hypothetical protein n=1 Tax=Streptomyces sp. NPDC020883 TaxID=3365099 RepID=UPI0037A094C0
MSTPPESSLPRSLAREAAGLLLAAAGVLVVLVALAAVHPVLSATVAAAGTVVIFRFMALPKTKRSRAVALSIVTVTGAAAVGCAFAYFPLLGWIEAGAALSATGAWLASEGT